MLHRKDEIVSAVGAALAAECTGGVDTDNVQEGDQNGPEEPDVCVQPAPPGP